MNRSDWLKWVAPPPVSEEEITLIESVIAANVEHFRPIIASEKPWGETHKRIKRIQNHLNSVVAEIETLPLPLCTPFQTWDRDAQALRASVDDFTTEMKPPSRGRPVEQDKRWCVCFVYLLLVTFGKRHGTHADGPVVGLSRLIWSAAGGGDMTTNRAWEDLAKDLNKQAWALHRSKPPQGAENSQIFPN